VLIQIGGWVMLRLGHWRSVSGTAGKARYLVAGLVNMAKLLIFGLLLNSAKSVALAAGRATKR
jgi:hypothetical protein